MVLSGSTRTSRISSIINRPTCGGNKKAGIAPSIGWFMNASPSLIRAPATLFGLSCVPNTINQNQQTGYHATRTGRMG